MRVVSINTREIKKNNMIFIRKANVNIKVVVIIIILAVFLFNFFLFVFAVKTGLMRVEFGPKEEEKTDLLEIYEMHDQLLYQKVSVREDEKRLDKEVEKIEEEKEQIDIDKNSLTDQKKSLEIVFEEEFDRIKRQREEMKLVRSEFEEKRLKQLAKIYEGMKPREVVKVFENMDINIVADVLIRMKSRSSAKIMGKMRPVMASTISEMLKTGKRLNNQEKR